MRQHILVEHSAAAAETLEGNKMAKSADEARKQNTYKKPSGVKVTVPSRSVNSKQTKASEATLGRAQDTGKGRGPLRGVARRSREGMEFMSDEAT